MLQVGAKFADISAVSACATIVKLIIQIPCLNEAQTLDLGLVFVAVAPGAE